MKKKVRKEKGFTTFELLIAVSVISVMAYFAFGYYNDIMLETKEKSLEQELKNIRRVVDIYYQRQNKYPDSLIELQEQGFIDFEGKEEKDFALTKSKITEEGKILDPFGNPYFYENGVIRSVSGGYEKY